MSETYNLVEATMKIIQDRRSIREYSPEPVSDKDLDLILEAARQAPSGENAQPWRFIVVKRPLNAQEIGGDRRRRERQAIHLRVCYQQNAGTVCQSGR